MAIDGAETAGFSPDEDFRESVRALADHWGVRPECAVRRAVGLPDKPMSDGHTDIRKI